MTNSVLYKNITRKETMKKLLLLLAILWVGLNAFAKSVQADDYNKAVVAHVIKENISGNGVDMSVLESEMQKIAYQFALEMTNVVEKHLPTILESLAAEMRMKADQKYKESLYD